MTDRNSIDRKHLRSTRARFCVFAICLLSVFSGASTLTATLVNGQRDVSPTAYLHFELYNCGTNFPTIQAQQLVIVPTAFDLKATQSNGTIVGQFAGNEVISCGNVASSEWTITPMIGALAQYRCFLTGDRLPFLEDRTSAQPFFDATCQSGNLQLMDGEWCASSISMVMRKPISPVTEGSNAPYSSTRWILTVTGRAFWAATILLSANSEKTSPSRGFLMTRSALAIDTGSVVRYLK